MLTMWRAQGERISREARRTSANRVVILGGTLRPESTGVRTRVRAFLVHACKVRWTLSVNDAFWSARRWNTPVFW